MKIVTMPVMRCVALSVLLPLSAASVNAQVAAPVAVSAQAAVAPDLDADVARILSTFDVPGMAVAIVKDGKVLATRGFGVRKLGEAAPVDDKTLFAIASNSKAFTAVALAMLVDEGKLAWDDPVTKHLPDFQMYDPYVTREMTVRDLLVHRSGLGLGAGDLLWWPDTTFTPDEIIARLRYVKPATSFRDKYAYDNLLYIVAGKIIAQKSGKSWGETVRERILAPLGMDTTTTSIAANAGKPDVAHAHSKINGKAAPVKTMAVANADGAVGINSNAQDMARWMIAQLDGGVIDKDRRLYSAKQAAEMWSVQTPMEIKDPPAALAATKPNFLAYGLGIQLRDYKGMKIATHSGALQGFYSRVTMVPEAKLGIAILTNAENGSAMQALQYRLLDHYLGAAPTDWISLYRDDEARRHAKDLAAQKTANATRAAKSVPSLPLSAYDGEYQDAWYGKVSIKQVGKKRVLSFGRTADLTGQLEHFQHNTFIVRWDQRNLNADAYVTFDLNPDGSIERMKMAKVSDETDFSYDYQDLVFTPVAKPK
ncbi:serine hydrolase [Massilia sp. CF038]|uniref:serine hydrolase n=1 Tax=Massilia sp. CF038 TaxID=1881045 RepID=UPI00091933F2|nr:serine hydrolase [Massilia sp. CF038]SHH69654.1 CubicO group peptidase, beta-lactamase class C family [Massilia sp. CF038]